MNSQRQGAPQVLGDLIDTAIDDLGVRTGVDQSRAIEVWHDIAGPIIARVTERVWVRRGKMYVELNSGTWRQELHMHRIQWRDRLNEKLGKRIINEIVFR